ncbi:hypothetical protein CK203_081988 [Vitis vinifera]|uniref:Uncharacterized protein n=1 Tax=Vitis vinifera TaxID=29760 RepID=A0A438BWB1_VITVI|nr:hypothetical protein CK203_081988 [Vitis vinifera]
MPKHMPVVSAKLVNIVFRELHPDEDQAISYYLRSKKAHCHGNPLSEHHYRGDGLMLFNCNGLIPMTYSFNGRWLAVTVNTWQEDSKESAEAVVEERLAAAEGREEELLKSRETFLRGLPLPFELKGGFYGLVRGKQILAREEILCFGRHFLLEGLRWTLEATGLFVVR